MKQLHTLGVTVLASLMLYSCQIEKYDISHVDSRIAIGGDSLAIPLGSTTKLTLDDFTSKIGDYLVTSQDNSYYFEFKHNFESKGDFPEFTQEQRTMASMEQYVPIELSLPNPGILPGDPVITIPELSFPIDRQAVLEIELDDEVTEYISSLDSMILENDALLCCEVDMSKLPSVDADPLLNLTIKFPERYIFNDNRIVDNILVLNNIQIQQDVKFILTPGIKMRGLRFDKETISEHLVIKDTVDISLSINYTDAQVGYETANNLSVDGDITVGVTNIILKELYGVIKYSTDSPQTSEITIEDMPNEIRNQLNILDVSPIMDLEYTSNISVPIRTAMNLVPYSNYEELSQRTVDFTMDLPAADRNLDETTSYIHIGPAPSATANINVVKDLSPLLKTIPDMIKLEYTMSTIENEQHYLDLSKSVTANIDCSVKVPLSFGPELYINYTDTMEIEDMDSNIMKILQNNRLHLIMDFNTTLPFDISLDLSLLDQDGNTASQIIIPSQTIKAGKRNQEEKSHFDIEISDPQKSVENLTGLIYSLTVTVPDTYEGNACIYTDSYLHAKMSFMAQGGIILNLEDYEN